MPRWNRALVTGASSGIGRAIAAQLAADGTELVLVARNTERLDKVAESLDVDCEVVGADLAVPDELRRVEERIADDPPIDLVVNNAGFGFAGRFEELDVDRESDVVAVNSVAVMRLCHAAASSLRARGDGGGILNVSSMAAFVAAPEGATYGASKAFVNSLSEALHTQLKRDGIHVTALCPGFTRTEFQARADYDASQVPDRLWQTAEEVAASGLAGVAANKAIVVPGATNRAGAALINVVPSRLRRFVMSKMPG